MTIEVPKWAMIGEIIEVKDVDCIRGDNPCVWYKEKIIAYGLDGIFHQAFNCPVYYSRFSEYKKQLEKQNNIL